MVFLSTILRRYIKPPQAPAPHRYWRRRRILSMSGHFYGRNRKCFSMAIRAVHRSFLQMKNGNKVRNMLIRRIYTTRLDAACHEFNTDFETMRKTLINLDIGLNRKILQNFAIWEPRTFRSLAMLTKSMTEVQGWNSLTPPPKGVITRGMLNVDTKV